MQFGFSTCINSTSTKYGLPDMEDFEKLVRLPDTETQRSSSGLSKHKFKLKLQHSHTSRWTRFWTPSVNILETFLNVLF